jgi:hypothetical protein
MQPCLHARAPNVYAEEGAGRIIRVQPIAYLMRRRLPAAARLPDTAFSYLAAPNSLACRPSVRMLAVLRLAIPPSEFAVARLPLRIEDHRRKSAPALPASATSHPSLADEIATVQVRGGSARRRHAACPGVVLRACLVRASSVATGAAEWCQLRRVPDRHMQSGRAAALRAAVRMQAANIRLLIEIEERTKREARLGAELAELQRAVERASCVPRAASPPHTRARTSCACLPPLRCVALSPFCAPRALVLARRVPHALPVVPPS